MKPDITENDIKTTKPDDSTNPVVFKWTDPNASIPKRIMAAIVCIMLLPLWVFCAGLGVTAWLGRFFLQNVKGHAPAPTRRGSMTGKEGDK